MRCTGGVLAHTQWFASAASCVPVCLRPDPDSRPSPSLPVSALMRPRVFFDVALGDDQPRRVIFELYNDIVPKTAENFRALATGEKGLSQLSQTPLYYKNSIIHRAIKGFMVQGGDFTKHNGSGGESIYGGPFPDEDLSQPLDSEGLLVMANKGPNTNGSQWFVTLRACPHLNGKHVVFGRVLKGYDVIEAVADVPTDEKDHPLKPVVIVNCGELIRKAAAAERDPSQQPERSRKRSASVSRSASPEERDRKKRSKRRHRDGDADGSGDDRKHKKKKDKKHSKHRHRSTSQSHEQEREREKKDEPPRAKEPRQETEEEYDARLEREEKERLEASRLYHLAEMKRRYEREQRPSSNGIIYKGRGEMRFRD